MKKLTGLILLSLISTLIFAQNWEQYLPQEKRESGNLTLFDFQEAFRKYTEPYNIDNSGYYTVKGEKHKFGGWKQFKRDEYLMSLIANPRTGEFPETDAWQEWNEYLKRNPGMTDSPNGDWSSLGPTDLSGDVNGLGRLNCVAFHPTNDDILWVGAPTGGLWVTYNHGLNWGSLFDDEELIGVSDIVIPDDFPTSNTIYVATGDRDKWKGSSIGVLKSTDGGANWETTGLTFDRWDFIYINRLLKHPTNDDIIYAATTAGVYKTTDGGSTFTYLTSYRMIDMEFKPGDPTVIYGSSKTYGPGTIYRSLNSGGSWVPVYTLPDNYRAEIAVSPNQPGWIYAVSCEDDGSLLGIYKSEDSGTNWAQVYDGTVPGQNLLGWNCQADDLRGQGGYDLCIAVNPGDANDIFLGGINTWRSTDGGISWQINNFPGGNCGGGVPSVHVDKHNLVFRPNSTELYECNDGGIYFTTDLGSSWTDISEGLVIGQIYRFSTAQTVPQEIIAGFQDVSTKLLTGGSWEHVIGADGAQCIINPADVNNQYAAKQNGTIYRTTMHWVNIHNISDHIVGDSGGWITPYVLDPNDYNTIYVGYTDLWKSTNQGDNFTKVHDFADIDHLVSVTVAPSNSLALCVSNPVNYYITVDGGTNWTELTPNLPLIDRFVTNSTFKQTNDSVIWACLSGYDQHKVYRTADRGNTWENISAGLPHIPVYDVVENTLVSGYEELYCATQMGVFMKLGNQDWVPFMNGLPNVWCHDLEIYYDGSNSKLRVATWGRGIWETDLYTSANLTTKTWSGLSSTDWTDAENWQTLEVPATNDTVLIPGDCPHYPYIQSSIITCGGLIIDSTASLSIGANKLVVNGRVLIDGELNMDFNSSQLEVGDDILWEPNSSIGTMSGSAMITVNDDWYFEPGSNITLTSGFVKFAGNSANSSIITYGENCEFHHLIVAKDPGRALYYPTSATGDITITGTLSIWPGSKLVFLSTGYLYLEGTMVNNGTYQFDNGLFYFSGNSMNLSSNSNCYFKDLVINKTGESFWLMDDITINNDLRIINGSLYPQGYRIHLGGDWYNYAGTDGFIEASSDVMFEGGSQQRIYHDETFNRLTLNNGANTLKIYGENILCAEYNWVSGTLDMDNGYFTAMDLYDEGIDGNIIVRAGGSVELHSTTFVHIKGDVTIFGGNMDVYGGTGGGISHSYWPYTSDASLTMSGGVLDFHDVGVYLNGASPYTFTASITGGTIKTAGDFYGDADFFNPGYGEVVLYGPGPANLGHGPNGGFNKLIIDKSVAADNSGRVGRSERPTHRTTPKNLPPNPQGSRSETVTLASNVDISGTLDFDAGELDISSYSLTVGSNFIIEGTLTMNNSSGEVTAYNFSWQNGSDANITEGNIFFEKNWSFLGGTNAVIAGNNTVTASGSGAQQILDSDDDAAFSNLSITNTTGQITFYAPGNAILINGDLRPQSGSSIILNDSIVVGDYIYIYDNADLFLDDGHLITENDLNLQGNLHIFSGEVKVADWMTMGNNGNLTIDDGLFSVERAYSGSPILFYGSLNLGGGILEILNEGLIIAGSNPANITGGTLKVGADFSVSSANMFQPAAGTVRFIGGHLSDISVKDGNYFYDLVVAKNPTTVNCTTSDSIHVMGNLTIISGDLIMNGQKLNIDGSLEIGTHASLVPGTSGTIEIAGDWTNLRGSAGFAEGNSQVVFDGMSVAYLFSDETFYVLSVDKNHVTNNLLNVYDNVTLTAMEVGITDGAVRLHENTVFNISNDAYISGDGALLLPDFASNGHLNVSGVMEVAPGGTISVHNSTADFNSELMLDGNLEITNSTVEAHSWVFYGTGSSFVLNSGTFLHSQPGPGAVTVKGGMDIHGGIYLVTDRDVIIHSSVNEDITGGTILLPASFTALTASTFNPSGGEVRFYGPALGEINMDAANHFYDMTIDKAGGQLNLQSNITLYGDFNMQAGYFDPLYFDMEVGGDWSNEAGPGFIDMVGVDVNFISSKPAQILTNEDFYRLYITKTTATGQYLEIAPSKNVNVSKFMTINDGSLLVNEFDTLTVNEDITISAGSGLICSGSANGIVIECGEVWRNYNTGYDMYTGFSPGLSEVVFTSDYYSGGIFHGNSSETFYDLTIDNQSETYINSNITVLNDFKAMGGYFYTDDPGFSYFLEGDFLNAAPSIYYVAGAIIFCGDEMQQFTDLSAANNWLNEVVVSKENNTDADLSLQLNSSMRVNSMVVDTGLLDLNSNTLTCLANLDVNAEGYMMVNNSSTLVMEGGSSIGVEGGTLEVIGTETLTPAITSDGPGNYYEFVIFGDGTLKASRALFEYMDATGISFQSDGILHDTYSLNHCTFQNGAPGGQLLKFNNYQTVTISGAHFPQNTWSGGHNVRKSVNAGNVTFDQTTTGDFAGPAYEYDLYNRVHWIGAGLWTGEVSADWHTGGNWQYDIVPGLSDDVIIPDSTPNDPHLSSASTQVNSLLLEENATLTITSYLLDIQDQSDIYGQMDLLSAGAVYFWDVNWKSGGSLNMSSGSLIEINRDMVFEEGSAVSLTSGLVRFKGGTPSNLVCNQDSTRLLTLQLLSGKELHYHAGSSGDLLLGYQLKLAGNSKFYGDATRKIHLEGYISNTNGHIYCDNTHFVLSGNAGGGVTNLNEGDYFHDLTVASTSLLSFGNTYSDTVRILGNLTLENGPSGSSGIQANGVIIKAGGNWDNNIGASGFIHGSNEVFFINNSGVQDVTGDNVFYNLYDHTSETGWVRFDGVTEIDKSIYVNHKVEVVDSVFVNSTLYLTGPADELLISPGGYMEVTSFKQGGNVESNGGTFIANDLYEDYIFGIYHVNGGSVELHQNVLQTIDLAADLDISSGSMTIHGGDGISNWPADLTGNDITITMTGGILNFVDQGIHIEDISSSHSLTENISGGTIRTPWGFYCRGANTAFSPSGGVIELYGSGNSDVEMSGTGNAFWNLHVNKAAGKTVKANVEVNIQNELNIMSGFFNTMENPVNVGQ